MTRARVLALPAGVVLLAAFQLVPRTLGIVCLAAILAFAALRSSYWGAYVARSIPGIGVVSAIGVVAGLAALSPLHLRLPAPGVDAREFLILAVGFLIASLSIERLARWGAARSRILIVGAPDGGAELLRDLAQHPDLPFDCVGIVEDPSPTSAQEGLRHGTLSELAEIVTEASPDLIVIGEGPTRDRALHHLLNAAPAHFHVIGLDQFYEYAFGRVPVEHLSPVWFMSVLHVYQKPYSRLTKRIFDLTLVWIGIAMVAPLFLVLALLVRLSGPGPVIFRQVRLGEGGRTFEMLKLRSMIDAAEVDGKAVWAAEHDPRGTRIGSFIRSTRLDELPQFWNVVRGEMSLVGPRPERPEFLTLLQHEIPLWTSRHLVKPGITGWAQVRAGATSDARGAAEKLSYDLYYLRHRSVLIDLGILAKTARIVPQGLAALYRHRSAPVLDQAHQASEHLLASPAEVLVAVASSADGGLVPDAERAPSS